MKRSPRTPRSRFEICILAGGLSSRMGRDKARLLLGRKTFLAQIRCTAKQIDVPVRMVRRDRIGRCGPLGGIYTALTAARGEAILFLACDMPFVAAPFLGKLMRRFDSGTKSKMALFTSEEGWPEFPFILSIKSLPAVKQQIDAGIYSVRALAEILDAKVYRASEREKRDLFNINTPEEFAEAALRVETTADSHKKAQKPQKKSKLRGSCA